MILEKSIHSNSVKETSISDASVLMPTLRGYNYTDDEAHHARKNRMLLSMRVELSHVDRKSVV